MNHQELSIPGDIAGSEPSVSISARTILPGIAAFEPQQDMTFPEENTLEKEYIMWKAASADISYIRNMQAHDI